MQRIFGKANVNRVFVDEGLQISNETSENGLFSARMEFTYIAETENGNGGDADAMSFLGEVKGNNTFTTLLALSRAKVPNGEDLLAYAKKRLEGREIIMTTYVATISELTNGKADICHRYDRPEKMYRSLNDSYVGDYKGDEKAVFDKMQTRLRSAEVEGNLILGLPKPENEPEHEPKKPSF